MEKALEVMDYWANFQEIHYQVNFCFHVTVAYMVAHHSLF